MVFVQKLAANARLKFTMLPDAIVEYCIPVITATAKHFNLNLKIHSKIHSYPWHKTQPLSLPIIVFPKEKTNEIF